MAWQWRLYPEGHTDARNLVIHALTIPLFWSGIASIAWGLASGAWTMALSGLLAFPLTMILQGIGHRLEKTAPVPFRSPVDALARLFVEQLITLPRFVLTGAIFRR